MSCGIDSMYMLIRHLNSEFSAHNLTHLTIFNIGAFSNKKQFSWQCNHASQIAGEVGLPLIQVDSNFAEVIPESHVLTNSYRNLSLVFLLQKLFGRYYLSSTGYGIKTFSIENNDLRDCAYYDVLTCSCLSNTRLQFHSDGAAVTRLEKTKTIINSPLAQKYLHVCVADQGDNCGLCPKCRRTLLTLDALGALDSFKSILPVDIYKEHRREYYGYMFGQVLLGEEGDHFIPEIYDLLKSKVLFSSRLLGLYYACRRRLTKIRILRKIYSQLLK